MKMENRKNLKEEIHDANDQHHENELDDIFSPNLFKKDLDQLTNRQDLSQMLKSRLIDLSKDKPKIEYLLTRNGIGCLSKGDFQIIKGRKKSGKSTFITILVTALIKDNFMGFKAVKSGLSILYLDTEQNPCNTAIMKQKVNEMCGKDTSFNHPQFTAYNLRGDNPTIRRKLISQAVLEGKPDLVVIDGIKDLLESGDINNASDSNSVVQFLMELTLKYNLPILTVIHQNKGDTELRGHLGAEIGNKMSEEWQLTKINDVFTVKQVENRNEQSDAFYLRFQLDNNKLPVLIDDKPQLSKVDETKQKKINAFQKCLPQGIAKRNKDLSNDYCKAYGCDIKTTEKDLNHFKTSGYLIHQGSLYRFNYDKLSTENSPSVDPTTLP